jgi:hypothetical protein
MLKNSPSAPCALPPQPCWLPQHMVQRGFEACRLWWQPRWLRLQTRSTCLQLLCC